MAVPLVTAGLGMAAPVIANKLGIGKNDTRAKTFNETSAYNPHAFQYGGREGAADEAAQYFRGQATDAQGRVAPQAGLVNANYGRANAWDAQAGLDRNYQNDTAHMMLARAQGLVPSIASQQAALDMQRATAAQSSAAASARGAGGLALAGQNAANNTATMQSAITNNAQINAANERLAAEQGAYGAFSGMRGQDFAAQQQAAQQAQWNAQFGAQQNQFNAQMQNQRNAQNDAYALGLYNQEAGVRQQQLYGGMTGQQMLNTSTMNATNQNVAISQANADREFQYYKQFMGSMQGGADAATQHFAATPAPSAPQPATGVGAPTSGTGGGSTNMAGVPVPSDDRMKFGIMPLGLLGAFGPGGGSGGNMNPTSGPAASSYEVLSGGGENVAASGQAMNANAMRFQSDPTSYGDGPGAHGGMMNQGLLSDDRAKREYFQLGAQYATRRLTGEEMQPWADDPDPEVSGAEEVDPGPQATHFTYSPSGPHPLPDPPSYAPSGPHPLPPPPAPKRPADRGSKGIATEPIDLGGLLGDVSIGGRRAPAEPTTKAADPVTAQFATGLAPIRYQYKPGMGPAGEQTGVRAQGAASQPITASMVQRRPDGLLQIDPQMGLGTALAGVGHLAQKQENLEKKFNGLLAMSARREGIR